MSIVGAVLSRIEKSSFLTPVGVVTTLLLALISSTTTKSQFTARFSAFLTLRGADSMYIHHYTLVGEPNLLLEQRSTLNSGCPSKNDFRKVNFQKHSCCDIESITRPSSRHQVSYVEDQLVEQGNTLNAVEDRT